VPCAPRGLLIYRFLISVSGGARDLEVYIKSDAGHRAEAKALNPAVLLVVSPNCLPGDQIGKDC
jgi:hypothetical protein